MYLLFLVCPVEEIMANLTCVFLGNFTTLLKLCLSPGLLAFPCSPHHAGSNKKYTNANIHTRFIESMVSWARHLKSFMEVGRVRIQNK